MPYDHKGGCSAKSNPKPIIQGEAVQDSIVNGFLFHNVHYSLTSIGIRIFDVITI